MHRIRELREDKGLTQVRLAVAADMNPATLNRIEMGKANPNLKTLERLAGALDITVSRLLEDDSPKVEPSLFEDGADEQRRRFTAEQLRNIAWAVMNESAGLFLVVMEEIAQNVEHTVASPAADLEALFNAQNMAMEAVGYFYTVRRSYPEDAPAPVQKRLEDLEKRLKAARSEARTAFRKRRDEARRLEEEDSLKVVNLREEEREEWRRDTESATA